MRKNVQPSSLGWLSLFGWELRWCGGKISSHLWRLMNHIWDTNFYRQTTSSIKGTTMWALATYSNVTCQRSGWQVYSAVSDMICSASVFFFRDSVKLCNSMRQTTATSKKWCRLFAKRYYRGWNVGLQLWPWEKANVIAREGAVLSQLKKIRQFQSKIRSILINVFDIDVLVHPGVLPEGQNMNWTVYRTILTYLWGAVCW